MFIHIINPETELIFENHPKTVDALAETIRPNINIRVGQFIGIWKSYLPYNSKVRTGLKHGSATDIICVKTPRTTEHAITQVQGVPCRFVLVDHATINKIIYLGSSLTCANTRGACPVTANPKSTRLEMNKPDEPADHADAADAWVIGKYTDTIYTDITRTYKTGVDDGR